MIGRAEARLEQKPFGTDHCLGADVELAVEGDWLLALHLEIDLHMVVEIFAHARQFVQHRNAGLPEDIGRAYPRELEKLG